MNNNQKKENRSIYLYTALIFLVALILILLTAFSQTNISRLGKRAEEFKPEATATAAPTQIPDELANIANMASALDAENKKLNSQIADYEKLIAAYAQTVNAQLAEAEATVSSIDETMLNDNQKLLLNEIKNKINEGKEQ